MTGPLHSVVRGNRAGPALLLIHPLGADLRFWEAATDLLADDYLCFACDLRSAGRSPIKGAPVDLAEHVYDLAELRRQAGLGRVVPVGCAVGAMIAASLAAALEADATALILTSPAVTFGEAARLALRERVRLVQNGGMQALLPDAVDRAFHDLPRDERYREYLDRFARQDPQGYCDNAEGIVEADIGADLRSLRCPTLIVTSDNDLLIPPAMARAAHGLAAGSQLRSIHAGAHFIPYQAPGEFVRVVREFLAGVAGLEGSGIGRNQEKDRATGQIRGE